MGKIRPVSPGYIDSRNINFIAMTKTYQYHQLKESAQVWAAEKVSEKHPGEPDLGGLVSLYEYNREGDIMDLVDSIEEDEV